MNPSKYHYLLILLHMSRRRLHAQRGTYARFTPSIAVRSIAKPRGTAIDVGNGYRSGQQDVNMVSKHVSKHTWRCTWARCPSMECPRLCPQPSAPGQHLQSILWRTGVVVPCIPATISSVFKFNAYVPAHHCMFLACLSAPYDPHCLSQAGSFRECHSPPTAILTC